MRALSTFVLALLSTLPLAAHHHHGWRAPRRSVVVVRPYCADPAPWRDARRWDCDDPRRPWGYREPDCGVVFRAPLPRPLLPPFQGQVVLRFR